MSQAALEQVENDIRVANGEDPKDVGRTCPWCGCRASAEFVDIGVGWQQVTPYVCDHCGAQEFNWHHDLSSADAIEKKHGWWRPN